MEYRDAKEINDRLDSMTNALRGWIQGIDRKIETIDKNLSSYLASAQQIGGGTMEQKWISEQFDRARDRTDGQFAAIAQEITAVRTSTAEEVKTIHIRMGRQLWAFFGALGAAVAGILVPTLILLVPMAEKVGSLKGLPETVSALQKTVGDLNNTVAALNKAVPPTQTPQEPSTPPAAPSS